MKQHREAYIENILKKPAINDGQIWWNAKTRRELLIVNMQVVLISPIIELQDGNDVILSPSEFPFLPAKRICLRTIKGIIQAKELNLYIGDIGKRLTEVKNSLSLKPNYDEYQLAVIDDLRSEVEGVILLQ